jgi:hypothetical protein
MTRCHPIDEEALYRHFSVIESTHEKGIKARLIELQTPHRMGSPTSQDQ